MSVKKLCTSTIAGDEIVPWLAATGPLSYSPRKPPERDYYFQYSWVIPEIFAPNHNRRSHFWFGERCRDGYSVGLLVDFWNNARKGVLNELFYANGKIGGCAVMTPIGAYGHKSTSSFEKNRLILIQHGSYLITYRGAQQEIEDGNVILYCGIQNLKTFKLYRLNNAATRSIVMQIHGSTLIDSVLSFNTVHCNVCRAETITFNDRSNILGEMLQSFGLDAVKEEQIRSVLYAGYALESCYGVGKFGPNYLKFRTPLSNLRITTFVCNETEVKVIDTNKLEVLEAVGCKVKEIEI